MLSRTIWMPSLFWVAKQNIFSVFSITVVTPSKIHTIIVVQLQCTTNNMVLWIYNANVWTKWLRILKILFNILRGATPTAGYKGVRVVINRERGYSACVAVEHMQFCSEQPQKYCSFYYYAFGCSYGIAISNWEIREVRESENGKVNSTIIVCLLYNMARLASLDFLCIWLHYVY